MRFSSALSFKHSQPAPERTPAVELLAAGRTEPAPAAPSAVAQEPPDDLDERVRRIGEWQLGEA